MVNYDTIFEALQEAVISGDITEEFAESVNDLAYEKYVIEAENENSDMYKNTSEIVKDIRSVTKDFNSTIKDVQQDIKSGKLDRAESTVSKMIKDLSVLRDKVISYPPSKFDAAKEYILGAIKDFAAAQIVVRASMTAADAIFDVPNTKSRKKDRSDLANFASAGAVIGGTMDRYDKMSKTMTASQRTCVKRINTMIDTLERFQNKINKARNVQASK